MARLPAFSPGDLLLHPQAPAGGVAATGGVAVVLLVAVALMLLARAGVWLLAAGWRHLAP
ncbi:MAG TPA: hypothetical protein VE152_05315 [Acidimicrobiales bacterium]|jgi:hypothetical protein|nr:hypothetical protein [Acidimicrobiales bacterium]